MHLVCQQNKDSPGVAREDLACRNIRTFSLSTQAFPPSVVAAT